MTIARIPVIFLIVAFFTSAAVAQEQTQAKASKLLSVVYPSKEAGFNKLEPASGQTAVSPLVVLKNTDKAESGQIKFPPLVDLQTIDRAEVVEKKELLSLKIPPSTQKILNKLPSELGEAKRALPKGKESMDKQNFTGNKDPDSFASISAKPEEKKSRLNIQLNDKKADESMETLAMASRAYNVGQYETAVALYKRVLLDDKKNRDALFGIATSYHKNGQKPQAKQYYAKLLDLFPSDAEGQNNLLSLVAEEAPTDALVQFDALIKANPDYAPLHAHKAMVYTKMGDDENAIKNFLKALKLDPQNNSYRYNLAILLDKSKDYDNAYILYSQLLEESYKGNFIPTNRKQLIDRITYVSAKTSPAATGAL